MPQDYYAPPGANAPTDDFAARLDQPAELVGRALNLFFAHKLAYGGLGLAVLGPVSALAQAYALTNPAPQGEVNWGELRVTVVGGALAMPLAVAGVLAILSAHRAGEPLPTLGRALAQAARHWGPLLSARLFSGIKIGIGLLLLLVPGIYFAVQLALTDQWVVLGGERTASKAMAGSEAWTRNRLGQVFAVTFAAVLATNVPGLALGIVGAATELQPLVWLGAALDCALNPIVTIAGALMYWDLQRTGPAEAPT